MQIETYDDFIVERLEIPSLITILATFGLLFTVGIMWAVVPCVVFHGGAYLGWRRFKKSVIIQPELRNSNSRNNYQ